jgi:hypothetical protein
MLAEIYSSVKCLDLLGARNPCLSPFFTGSPHRMLRSFRGAFFGAHTLPILKILVLELDLALEHVCVCVCVCLCYARVCGILRVGHVTCHHTGTCDACVLRVDLRVRLGGIIAARSSPARMRAN